MVNCSRRILATVWTLCGLHIDIYFDIYIDTYLTHAITVLYCTAHILSSSYTLDVSFYKYILIYILQAHLLEPLITPVGGVLRHVILPVRTPRDSCPHTGHQMSQGRKKNVARPGLEPRVSRLPCEHSTTELSSHTIDRLHMDMYIHIYVMYLAVNWE